MDGISLSVSHHCMSLEQHNVGQTQILWHSIIFATDVPQCLCEVYEL
jgi:hypothetical protein